MITVEVQGQGKFVIHPEKLPELLRWLENNSMALEVSTRPLHKNQTLLNE